MLYRSIEADSKLHSLDAKAVSVHCMRPIEQTRRFQGAIDTSRGEDDCINC